MSVGQYWRLHSSKPHHIGISGDPPLCRSCASIFSASQDLIAKKRLLSLSFNRLKASARLGCILCSMLYNAQWTPISRDRKDLPMSQKIRDLASPPDHLRCIIERSEETASFSHQREAECLVLHVTATLASVKDNGDFWVIDLLLVPENGISLISQKLASDWLIFVRDIIYDAQGGLSCDFTRVRFRCRSCMD